MLSDSVKVNQCFWRFLQYGWQGCLHKYLVLPFGLCLAPLVFTRMTKPLQAFLYAKGVRCIYYLNNILIIGGMPRQSQDGALPSCQSWLCSEPQEVVSGSGSALTLSRLQLDTVGGWTLFKEKHLKLVSCAWAMVKNPFPNSHELQVFLGNLMSAIPAVPLFVSIPAFFSSA